MGAGVSTRVEGRQGYRHGTRVRTVTTSLGPTTIEMPRARLHGSEDGTREWRSAMVPRYQRRTARVDEAILGLYLAGTNTRRVRGALAPLLRDVAVESAPNDERPGTDQRGIPPPHQDAVQPTEQRCGAAAPLWPAPQRRREAQSTRRMEGHAEDRSGGRVITRSDDASLLFHHLTDTTGEDRKPSRERLQRMPCPA